VHALDDRHPRQAPEAEHPDAEPDDPEGRENAHDDCGVPQSPRTPAVAGHEDRMVGRRRLGLWLRLEKGHQGRSA
jgi:hypothetical protein